MREKVLLIEATAKPPTVLTYVLFAVLFRPLHSKEVARPGGVSFLTCLCRVEKQSLVVCACCSGLGAVRASLRREKRLAPGTEEREVSGPPGLGPGHCSVSSAQRR